MQIGIPSSLDVGSTSLNSMRMGLVSILYATRRCEAMNLRDKVFALCNLAKDSAKIPFSADY